MPLRFTLRQLEYFVAVGEAGSIAKAAERMNVSSPSISAAIVQLEDELGLQLFVRKHAHGLSLTQAGRQIIAQARTVLHDTEALTRLADNIAGSVRGPLAVGCLLTFAQMVLPGLRRGFETRFPDVTIRQTERDQSTLIDMLRRADIDVALTYDLDVPKDLSFLPLAELPPYAVFGEHHPLADRASVSLSELQHHKMVLLDLPLSTEYFMSLFAGANVKADIAERTRDLAVLCGLVANDFGYAILNIRLLSNTAPDGRTLKFVPIRDQLPPLRMGLLTPKDAQNVLTVQAFIEFCRDTVSTDILRM